MSPLFARRLVKTTQINVPGRQIDCYGEGDSGKEYWDMIERRLVGGGKKQPPW